MLAKSLSILELKEQTFQETGFLACDADFDGVEQFPARKQLFQWLPTAWTWDTYVKHG